MYSSPTGMNQSPNSYPTAPRPPPQGVTALEGLFWSLRHTNERVRRIDDKLATLERNVARNVTSGEREIACLTRNVANLKAEVKEAKTREEVMMKAEKKTLATHNTELETLRREVASLEEKLAEKDKVPEMEEAKTKAGEKAEPKCSMCPGRISEGEQLCSSCRDLVGLRSRRSKAR